MCTPEDTQWLENFYQRIMNCCDPLACYAAMQRAASAKHSKSHSSQIGRNAEKGSVPAKDTYHSESNHSHRQAGWIILVILAVLALIIWHAFSAT